MFTNIPVTQSVKLMNTILQENNVASNIIAEFSSLLNLRIKNDVCMFQNKKYEFVDEPSMDHPRLSLMAVVFVDNFKTKVLGTVASFLRI